MEDKKIKKQPKKHLWKPEEDLILKKYVETHGEGNWATVSQQSGLKRGGKSCRLRWKNYLRPNIKRGDMSEEEQDLIIRMHKLLGNRWSLIAGRLPGRTDNEVKNYWNTHLNKRYSRGKRKHTDTTHKKPEDSHTFVAKSQKGEPNESEQKKVEEEKSLSNPSTGETGGINYGSELAITPPMFVFEDEPFAAFTDPFLFFGAYADMGMQSVIP